MRSPAPTTAGSTGRPPATASAWPTPTSSIEVEHDLCVGGDEAVFGGGKVIRESMGQSTRAPAPRARPTSSSPARSILDHWGVVKADIGVRDGRIVGIGKAGNPDTMDGVAPGAGDRAVHRDPVRQRPDPHRRRDRLPRPPHLPADRRRGAGVAASPRSSAAAPARPRARRPPPSRRARGTWPACTRRWTACRSTWCCSARATPSRTTRMWEQVLGGAGGFKLHEDWGTTPGRDRRLPHGRRRDRRAGGHPHRHAERGGLRRVDARGDRRPVDPHVPHRGRRRRPRAGHHHRGRAPERAAVVDQPDPPAHRQHPGRAPRHADGLPPPQPVGARGPGVRREPHPPVDHRRRGRAARPGRDLDHRQRLAGDGPRRRGRSCARGRPRT